MANASQVSDWLCLSTFSSSRSRCTRQHWWSPTVNASYGAQKVPDQDPVECLEEELLQRRTAAAAIDQIEAGRLAGEAPQPVGRALDPPAGLVSMQDGRLPGFVGDLLVPDFEDPGQALPDRNQAARAEARLQVATHDVDDLIDGHAEAVVQPRCQRHRAMADCRPGQRVGHDRLHVFLAAGAVVAMDRVLGGLGLDRHRDVDDHPGATALAALQGAAAIWTKGQSMLFMAVDLDR